MKNLKKAEKPRRERVAFKSGEVAHIWANKTYLKGHTPGNMSFDGDDFFSYQTVIARHVYKGRKHAVLLGTESISPSTGKHQWECRNAVPDNVQVLQVPYVRHWGGYHIAGDGPDGHGMVLNDFLTLMHRQQERLHKALKPGGYLATIRGLGEQAREYAKFFGIKVPKEIQHILRTESDKKYAVGLAREAEMDRKQALRREEENRVANERHERDRVEYEAKHKDDIPRWYACKRENLDRRLLGEWYLVRFNPESERFQTSAGVGIPLREGRSFFAWLQKVRAAGGCTDCNREIMGFQVRGVFAEYVEIGCHKIKFEEIENVAKTAGIIPAEGGAI